MGVAIVYLLRDCRQVSDGYYPNYSGEGALDQRGQADLPLQAHGMVLPGLSRVRSIEDDWVQAQQVRDGERAGRGIGGWIRRSQNPDQSLSQKEGIRSSGAEQDRPRDGRS